MLQRPWSISTTIRNPERIYNLLKNAKHFEGELYYSKIYISLILCNFITGEYK